MGPEVSTYCDIKTLSEGSKVMIGTIDRNYDTISKIQVTSKYIQANNLSCIE